MSSTKPVTTSTTTIVPVDLVAAKKRNEAWIAAWKKANGVKKQATLPTKVEEHTAWVLQQGWSMRDAMAWKNLCEKAKFSASVPIDADLDLLHDTLELAAHVDTHPIGLICFARCELHQLEWTLRAAQAIRDRFIGVACVDEGEDDDVVVLVPPNTGRGTPEDDDDAPTSGEGKKRKFIPMTQASQPYDDDVC